METLSTEEPTDPNALDGADMRALVAGEDAALNRLMVRWEIPLRSFLYRHLQNEHDALDLAQETFVRVHRHRHRFRPDARFSTWLFAIALNLARGKFRWRRRHPVTPLEEAPEPATADTPRHAAIGAERAAAVRAAIALLPADQREALLLAEFQGLPHAEIALAVGTSAKGVETRIYRARQALKKRLTRFLSDGH